MIYTKILLIFYIFSMMAYADFKEGEKLFENKCSSCHEGYISINNLKKNFFEKENKLYKLKAPTNNMLVYAITQSAKHIGDPEDPEMQQIEIEEYLKSYLEEPERINSICDEHVLSYYEKKKSMIITDEEAVNLSIFFMEFNKNRLIANPIKKRVLEKNYDEDKLLDDAKKENKYLMVYATSETCYFCKKMKKNVLNLDEVQDKLNKNYIFVEVDVDNISLPFSLDEKFKGMTPTFFIVNKNRKLLNTYPGSWSKNDFYEIMKENLK